MRIIAGQFRGKPLTAPPGRTTRPTAERTREALFNILEHAPWAKPLAGLRVLDLFAGSGALGLEALSRGAAFALFVETEASARGAIRTNIEALGLFGVTRIHRRDAADLGKKPPGMGDGFDLVFADPPYAESLLDRTLQGLLTGGWLAPDTLLCLETPPQEAVAPAPFTILDTRRYGAAMLTFLQIAQPSALP